MTSWEMPAVLRARAERMRARRLFWSGLPTSVLVRSFQYLPAYPERGAVALVCPLWPYTITQSVSQSEASIPVALACPLWPYNVALSCAPPLSTNRH